MVFLYVLAFAVTSHAAHDGVDCSDTAKSEACSAVGTRGTALLQKKTMLSSVQAHKTSECKDTAGPGWCQKKADQCEKSIKKGGDVAKKCPMTCGLCANSCEDTAGPGWCAKKADQCEKSIKKGGDVAKKCPRTCGVCPNAGNNEDNNIHNNEDNNDNLFNNN